MAPSRGAWWESGVKVSVCCLEMPFQIALFTARTQRAYFLSQPFVFFMVETDILSGPVRSLKILVPLKPRVATMA